MSRSNNYGFFSAIYRPAPDYLSVFSCSGCHRHPDFLPADLAAPAPIEPSLGIIFFILGMANLPEDYQAATGQNWAIAIYSLIFSPAPIKNFSRTKKPLPSS
ncbi:MAG UNVERIFIED_CONTAM: hypothetical protein LVR29_18010 [Microcystis novacekii LVE1205-3]